MTVIEIVNAIQNIDSEAGLLQIIEAAEGRIEELEDELDEDDWDEDDEDWDDEDEDEDWDEDEDDSGSYNRTELDQ